MSSTKKTQIESKAPANQAEEAAEKKKNKKNATKDGDTSSSNNTITSSGRLTWLNLVLLCLLMVGLGCILGYFVFVSLHRGRCMELLDAAEVKSTKSQQELNDRSAIRFEKHQDLMDRHQITVDQMLKLQADHAESLVLATQLQSDLEKSRQLTEKLEQERDSCQSSKGLLKTMVADCRAEGKL